MNLPQYADEMRAVAERYSDTVRKAQAIMMEEIEQASAEFLQLPRDEAQPAPHWAEQERERHRDPVEDAAAMLARETRKRYDRG